jgi:hypothetical protein
MGHTARTDQDLESFNSKYVQDYPAYRPGMCEDYAYQVLGWLLGQQNLLGNMLDNTRQNKEQEVEIYANESDEEEQVSDNNVIENDSDYSDDDDPSYIPQTECLDSESEDEIGVESCKRKRTNDEPTYEENIGKKRKPSTESQEYEEEDLEETENNIAGKSYKWIEEEEEFVENEKEDEEDGMNGEKGEFEDEEEEDLEDEEFEKYDTEEKEENTISYKNEKIIFKHTKEIQVQTEDESSSSDEDDDESSVNISYDYDRDHALSKEKDVEDEESGYSTHDHSLECVSTPAA